MWRTFCAPSFQTISFTYLKTSNLCASFSSSWNVARSSINDCIKVKKKFLFLRKKKQIFEIAFQSSARPMPLHTQNLKICVLEQKNKNLNDLLIFWTLFELLWPSKLQREANQSIYKIILKLSFSPKAKKNSGASYWSETFQKHKDR